MAYSWGTIKKKFPTGKFLLAVLCIILFLVVLGLLFPPIGTLFLGGLIAFGNLAANFGIALALAWQTWATLAIVGIIGFLVVYRRNYSKKKVLMPTVAPSLQGGLLNTQPLPPTPSSTVVVPEKQEETVVNG